VVGCPPVVAPRSRSRCALPPSGFGGKYTPRCLRKGGASAFAAEGGSPGAICYLVDLAVYSPVQGKRTTSMSRSATNEGVFLRPGSPPTGLFSLSKARSIIQLSCLQLFFLALDSGPNAPLLTLILGCSFARNPRQPVTLYNWGTQSGTAGRSAAALGWA